MTQVGLNPFEVREVLQDLTQFKTTESLRLNPFEVREVLQVILALTIISGSIVSIPLKSGRCCKAIAKEMSEEDTSQSL